MSKKLIKHITLITILFYSNIIFGNATSKLKFSTLWVNFTSGNTCVNAKTNKPPTGWENQCAAQLGYALEKSNISFKSFTGLRCSQRPKNLTNNGVVARAAELANWLKTQPFPGCPKPQDITGANWQDKIRGKTGIVFFAKYWRRNTDGLNAATGDHIDLWNGSTLTPSISSLLRFRFGIKQLHLPYVRKGLYDLGNSKQILFWEMR